LKKKASGEFNVVPDDVINIQEVAESVMDGLDVYKEIEWLGDGANWKGDNKIISASNQKLKDLGWSPDYTSKQAIKKSVEDSKA
jgi:nucleoside-diphosphate-sugar epimerase